VALLPLKQRKRAARCAGWNRPFSARIPVPKVTISEAVDLVTKRLRSGEVKFIDAEVAKPSEYIVMSAEYTTRFDDKKETGWVWKVRIVHPVHNDHSIIFRVTNDEKVTAIGGSERLTDGKFGRKR
jgi:hypothetical protein